MPRQQIVKVKDAEPTETWDGWGLQYADDFTGENDLIDEYDLIDEHPIYILEQVADFCDQNAESRINRDYCGTHRILAALLYQEVGHEQATKLLVAIAAYGGLDGMNGVGGEADAFEDFGIQDCWHDWKLPE